MATDEVRGTQHVVVIGAGIVGATTAVELLRDGHRVTLLEPEQPGGQHAASYGNGGWVSPSLVVPASVPGLWRSVPRYLAPAGPLSIRWSHLPEFLPWLWMFLRAGATVKRAETIASALRQLVSDSPQRHREFARQVGASGLFDNTALIHVFENRADFDSESIAWHLRRTNGVSWAELDQAVLHAKEPDLVKRYKFGVAVEGIVCSSPGEYVAAIVRHAVQAGCRLVTDKALGFNIERQGLRAVLTTRGEIPCDRAVIAAGAWSKPLVRAAGDKIYLTSERGYHVLIKDPESAPKHRILFTDAKIATTKTPDGLRVTGQAEFASIHAPANWSRAQRMRDFALASFQGMPKTLGSDRQKYWVGPRPSTPDSLPVIGPASRCNDIFYAFGHGHIGFCSAPMSARLVADLISGLTPTIPPGPYLPTRFSRFRVSSASG